VIDASKRAISVYPLDVASVGLASLLILVPLLVSPTAAAAAAASASLVWALNLTLNFPHFMASYALVYRSRAVIRRYWRATLAVPLVLAAWSITGIALAPTDGTLFHLGVVVAGLYIGIHYTGQCWGMMVAFGHLEGVRFEERERRLIRAGLYGLVVWHAASFAAGDLAQPPPEARPLLDAALRFSGWLVALTFFLSAAGIMSVARRLGRVPPARVLLPWVAVYAWYAVFAGVPNGAFWVQIAHSVQYLIFPTRMLVNNVARRGHTPRVVLVVAGWYLALLALGYGVFGWLPTALGWVATAFLDRAVADEAVRLLPMAVTVIVNVHHYYTDGSIWKMKDPDVRATLFAHLQRDS
jgi:hypothetical protein